MKTINFILIILTFSSVSFGQYKSIFGKVSTQWNIIPICSADGSNTYTFTLKGDTLINGNNYKIIDPNFIFGLGYLREDTISGKVWFYDKANSLEYLVVDMSLTKKDSFKVYDDNNLPVYFHIDSVYSANNLKYITFSDGYVSQCAGTGDHFLKFIEGTGTNVGFFYNRNISSRTIGSYIMCQEKDGIKVYNNARLPDTCYYTDMFIDVKNKNIYDKLIVSPNPTNGNVTIEIDNFSSDVYELVVFNSLSQLTHYYKISSSTFTFSLNNKNGGINFYMITNNKGFLKTGKIIKL